MYLEGSHIQTKKEGCKILPTYCLNIFYNHEIWGSHDGVYIKVIWHKTPFIQNWKALRSFGNGTRLHGVTYKNVNFFDCLFCV